MSVFGPPSPDSTHRGHAPESDATECHKLLQAMTVEPVGVRVRPQKNALDATSHGASPGGTHSSP